VLTCCCRSPTWLRKRHSISPPEMLIPPHLSMKQSCPSLPHGPAFAARRLAKLRCRRNNAPERQASTRLPRAGSFDAISRGLSQYHTTPCYVACLSLVEHCKGRSVTFFFEPAALQDILTASTSCSLYFWTSTVLYNYERSCLFWITVKVVPQYTAFTPSMSCCSAKWLLYPPGGHDLSFMNRMDANSGRDLHAYIRKEEEGGRGWVG